MNFDDGTSEMTEILGRKNIRQKRLGQALRENLLKRKAQTRAREEVKPEESEITPSNSSKTMAS